MKQFKNLQEVKDWFRNYQPFDKDDWDTSEEGYFYGHDDKPKMGDWMLFQHIQKGAYVDGKYQYEISRPILGLCIGHDVWDQALVLEFVEDERAYIWNSKIKIEVYKENGEFSHLNTLPIAYHKEIEHIVFWDDDIIVLGQWKHKPNWKELKKVLTNGL